MTDVWEAPAKINLSLQVRPPDRTGQHPIRSLVQTIDRLDLLEVDTAEDERLVVVGADIPDGEDNLVWKAVRALVGRPDRPRLDMTLHKAIPEEAGLGGGSADAVAALRGAARVFGEPETAVRKTAPTLGADVPFFLDGGSAWMTGHGETLAEVEPLAGFAMAVAVPLAGVDTGAAYRRWDALGGAAGPEVAGRDLPPVLRPHAPLRNDLTPAAFDLEPELADWSHELASGWGRPVLMTGSGSAHFAFFTDVDEAAAAASEVRDCRVAFGAGLRRSGVTAR